MSEAPLLLTCPGGQPLGSYLHEEGEGEERGGAILGKRCGQALSQDRTRRPCLSPVRPVSTHWGGDTGTAPDREAVWSSSTSRAGVPLLLPPHLITQQTTLMVERRGWEEGGHGCL